MYFRKMRDYTMSLIKDLRNELVFGTPQNPQHHINRDSTGQTRSRQLQIENSKDHEIDSSLNSTDGGVHPEREAIQAQNLSHAGVPQDPEVGGDDKQQYDEMTAFIKELEEELNISGKKKAEYRKDLKRVRKGRDKALMERDDAREVLHESKKEFQAIYDDYRVLKKKQNEMKKDYETALAQITRQKADISELTVKISHSLKTNGTTTRGDDYFERKFSSLEGAIRQFVFRSFCDVLNPAFRSDPIPTTQESLNATTFKDNAHPKTEIGIKEIEAAVIERLCIHVFHPSFLLSIGGKYHDIESLSLILGGSYLNKREWHAQTVAIIFEHDRYNDHLYQNISYVERDLQKCCSLSLQGDLGEKHRKSLLAITEQAAMLQKEIFGQVSPFELYPIKPGVEYDPLSMDDISSLADEGEVVETQSFIVRVAIFPMIVRWGFNEDGEKSERVIVRKGTVITMLNGQEEMAG